MSGLRRRRHAWRRNGPLMEYIVVQLARELADGDEDYAKDLAQEGRAAIWRHEEVRGLTLLHRVRRLRRVALNRMYKYRASTRAGRC